MKSKVVWLVTICRGLNPPRTLRPRAAADDALKDTQRLARDPKETQKENIKEPKMTKKLKTTKKPKGQLFFD